MALRRVEPSNPGGPLAAQEFFNTSTRFLGERVLNLIVLRKTAAEQKGGVGGRE